MRQGAVRMHVQSRDAVLHSVRCLKMSPNRNMHDANEHIDHKRFMKHGEICLQAMYDMIMEP